MKSGHSQHASGGHYRHLAMMAALSFAAMYALMYAMVDRLDNVYSNVNQLYMAGLMTAPMVLIELFIMRAMFPDKRINLVIAVAAVLVAVAFWFLIRAQGAVGDQQFLKSMIPHHAAAVLMCKKASISDSEIQSLCKQIVLGQEAEIKQMKAKLARIDRAG